MADKIRQAMEQATGDCATFTTGAFRDMCIGLYGWSIPYDACTAILDGRSDVMYSRIDDAWLAPKPVTSTNEQPPPVAVDVPNADIEFLKSALSAAHRDIAEWCRCAERIRAEVPDVNHVPWAPTSMGLEQSRRVQRTIGQAIAKLREVESWRHGDSSPNEQPADDQPAAIDPPDLRRPVAEFDGEFLPYNPPASLPSRNELALEYWRHAAGPVARGEVGLLPDGLARESFSAADAFLAAAAAGQADGVTWQEPGGTTAAD